MDRTASFAAVFETVKAQLREAAATLKRMRLEKGDYPSQRTAWWPDIVREATDAYGYNNTSTTLGAPAPAAIDRMEEALRWILWLEDSSQRIVWARAEKITWRQLEAHDGRCRDTLRKLHDRGLAVIVERLARR